MDLKNLKPLPVEHDAPAKITGLARYADEERVVLAMRVSQANYAPEGVRVRAQISEDLFTAEASIGALKRIAKEDPLVLSIAITRPMSLNEIQERDAPPATPLPSGPKP